jgi:hypothetical protein
MYQLTFDKGIWQAFQLTLVAWHLTDPAARSSSWIFKRTISTLVMEILVCLPYQLTLRWIGQLTLSMDIWNNDQLTLSM